MKTSLITELTTQALNEPVLSGINNSELRQRVLALAQLKLFKLISDDQMDREQMKDLLTIIKSLTTLDLREKDMVEKRALTETIRLNREEQRQREREAKQAANTTQPATVAKLDQPIPNRSNPSEQTPSNNSSQSARPSNAQLAPQSREGKPLPQLNT